MNISDAFVTLDGHEWDAESLADATALFLNAGLKPSTGTQSRNIRMAIESGVIQRNGSEWVSVQENILELDELMELDSLGIGDAFPFD
jgi:hypothetical protein